MLTCWLHTMRDHKCSKDHCVPKDKMVDEDLHRPYWQRYRYRHTCRQDQWHLQYQQWQLQTVLGARQQVCWSRVYACFSVIPTWVTAGLVEAKRAYVYARSRFKWVWLLTMVLQVVVVHYLNNGLDSLLNRTSCCRCDPRQHSGIE